jgi:hypothetical protein
MAKTNVSAIPHSWCQDDWPPGVYPGRPSRAKYVLRAHRDELVAVGALTRIGRNLVVLGAPYVGWLAKNSNRVLDFEIAPNRERGAKQAAA